MSSFLQCVSCVQYIKPAVTGFILTLNAVNLPRTEELYEGKLSKSEWDKPIRNSANM